MQIIYPSEAIKAGIATIIIPTDAVAARRDVLTITKLIKINFNITFEILL